MLGQADPQTQRQVGWHPAARETPQLSLQRLPLREFLPASCTVNQVEADGFQRLARAEVIDVIREM
jgi:hypothetical protein